MKKPIHKKWWFWFIIIIVSIGLGGLADNVNQTEESVKQADVLQQEIIISEPNTSEMADSIIIKAKEDAETATEEQKQEALDFIIDNRYDYFTGGDEMMEDVIYYGSILEYGYDSGTIESGIGMDAAQTVKYIYRGAETIDTPVTIENLRQIDKGIEELNNK